MLLTPLYRVYTRNEAYRRENASASARCPAHQLNIAIRKGKGCTQSSVCRQWRQLTEPKQVRLVMHSSSLLSLYSCNGLQICHQRLHTSGYQLFQSSKDHSNCGTGRGLKATQYGNTSLHSVWVN